MNENTFSCKKAWKGPFLNIDERCADIVVSISVEGQGTGENMDT